MGRGARQGPMQENAEREILAAIERGGAEGWEAFLSAGADVIFRAVRPYADSYDARMDLFLFVCTRLREGEMRRLRSFRPRPGAPCRFTTWLAVVVKNLAVDWKRANEGRSRPFRAVEAMDEADRLLFAYHLRDGRPLEEAGSLLAGRHGVRLAPQELHSRAARLHSSLSASQRWRLLARIFERRRAVSVDSVDDVAEPADRSLPLAMEGADPEALLASREAEQVLRESLATLSPRERLAFVLRYRDGRSAREIAGLLRISEGEAEAISRLCLERVRGEMIRSGISRPDLGSEALASLGGSSPTVTPTALTTQGTP